MSTDIGDAPPPPPPPPPPPDYSASNQPVVDEGAASPEDVGAKLSPESLGEVQDAGETLRDAGVQLDPSESPAETQAEVPTETPTEIPAETQAEEQPAGGQADAGSLAPTALGESGIQGASSDGPEPPGSQAATDPDVMTDAKFVAISPGLKDLPPVNQPDIEVPPDAKGGPTPSEIVDTLPSDVQATVEEVKAALHKTGSRQADR